MSTHSLYSTSLPGARQSAVQRWLLQRLMTVLLGASVSVAVALLLWLFTGVPWMALLSLAVNFALVALGVLAHDLLPGRPAVHPLLRQSSGVRYGSGLQALDPADPMTLDTTATAAPGSPGGAVQWRSTLIETAPIALAVTDSAGRLLEANRRFVKLYERSDIPPQGRRLTSLVRREDVSAVRAALKALSAGEHGTENLEVGLGAGAARIGYLSMSRVFVEDQAFNLCYFVDRTEQLSLQEQFVQAQKMQAVGQLAGGIAHDFNNLLTAILGFCDLLLSRHDPGDRSFSDLMQIRQNANRASNLVRQLLAFSRQQTMRPRVIRLSDALVDLAGLLRRLVGSQITLHLVHGREVAPILADLGQFEQVIVNLVVNARDAMPEGGELTITTHMISASQASQSLPYWVEPQDYVAVEVSDTGHGIPAELLDKIFEPFFTTKEVGRGTGLGLATAYGIIKQTGGYIFATSEPEQGAVLHLLFKPHTEAPEAEEKQREDTKPRDLSGSGTILVVEDEHAVRLLSNRALTARGYTVLEASSGDEGLEMLLEHKDTLDLLITDVVMPGLDGPMLAEEVRKHRSDLPVIFMSGYAENVVRKNLEDPSCYFLQKPFTLKALAELVKSIMEEHELQD